MTVPNILCICALGLGLGLGVGGGTHDNGRPIHPAVSDQRTGQGTS